MNHPPYSMATMVNNSTPAVLRELDESKSIVCMEISLYTEVSMHTILLLSSNSRSTAGVLLLTIVAIEYGGWFMLRVVRGRQPATPFQQAFFRAGHAHAGVLVILSLVCMIYVDATHTSGLLAVLARN